MSCERIDYHPLSEESGEIRLALLEPDFVSIGTDRSIPVLSLTHQATTIDWPAYCALSYTWGNPKDTAVAIIDGRTVRVTKNLRRFFERAARDLTASRSLEDDEPHWIERSAKSTGRSLVAVYWIDAICIDQANDLEKSSQVRFMSHIFSNAAKVVAWLGVHLDHSEVAFEFLNSAASMPDHHDEAEKGYSASRAAQLSRIATEQRLAQTLQSPLLVRSMQALSARSYWTRAWVFQEIALSSVYDTQILCGDSSLQMANFRKALRWTIVQSPEFWEAQTTGVSEVMLEVQDAIDRLQVLPSRAFPADADFQFTLAEHLLEAYLHGGHHATLPHDHVYSFLGISSDSSTCGITSNYSLSVAECFISTTDYFLGQMGGRALLMCDAKQHDEYDLPSWVPDWSHQQRSTTIVPIVASAAAGSSTTLFQCSGAQQQFSYRIRSCTLFVSAARLDKVVFTLDVPSFGHANLWKQDFTYGLFPAGILELLQKRYGKDVHAAMLCTVVADQLLSADVGHKRFSKFVGAMKINLQGSSKTLMRYENLIEHHYSSQELFADGRQLFVTESGYMGYGPDCVVKGDIAYIIHGLDIPLMLRAVDKSQFRLLGAAYIHGIMDGEAVADTCKWVDIGLQ